VIKEEIDLGVIMHKSAKPSRQCVEAARGIFNCFIIRRKIVNRAKGTIYRGCTNASLGHSWDITHR